MPRHSFSVNKRLFGRVFASSFGRITCLYESDGSSMFVSILSVRQGNRRRLLFAPKTYRYSWLSSAYFSLYSIREVALILTIDFYMNVSELHEYSAKSDEWYTSTYIYILEYIRVLNMGSKISVVETCNAKMYGDLHALHSWLATITGMLFCDKIVYRVRSWADSRR